MLSKIMALFFAWLLTSGAFADSNRARRIESIKTEILNLAARTSRAVTFDNEDNDPRVRAQLDRLVAELVRVAPQQTQSEKLSRVVGAWKSVWTDLTYFGPAPLANAVYQVVFPDGYYFNLSNYRDPASGRRYASVIKGEYTVQEPALKIKFVRFAQNDRPFRRGSDLATLAMRAQLGEVDRDVPSPTLGFESTFEQIYVDEDIRIGRGTNFNGFETLFILKRVAKVE